MPVAFSTEQQDKIRNSLHSAALEMLKTTSAAKITVEQLTKSVGISKGAFYKFYPSKEMLFYRLLRQLHDQIYAPALERMNVENIADPTDTITDAIISCLDVLDNSEYKKFWLEDAPLIMSVVPRKEKEAQKQAENRLFSAFLHRCGQLTVDEAVAFDALTVLISTAYMRKNIPDNYRTVLHRMAQGVCRYIFK